MTHTTQNEHQLTAAEISLIESALEAALHPNSHSNAVGCAMLVRAQCHHLSAASCATIEAALQAALHPTAQSNAVGVARLVRSTWEKQAKP